MSGSIVVAERGLRGLAGVNIFVFEDDERGLAAKRARLGVPLHQDQSVELRAQRAVSIGDCHAIITERSRARGGFHKTRATIRLCFCAWMSDPAAKVVLWPHGPSNFELSCSYRSRKDNHANVRRGVDRRSFCRPEAPRDGTSWGRLSRWQRYRRVRYWGESCRCISGIMKARN
jgi:hypothetical protein